jgi:RND family efflux transporter MFP subunit
MRLNQRALPCVILALLLPAGGCLRTVGLPPGLSRDRLEPRQVIAVEAAYPGASAKALVDAVVFPIEQEVNRIEKIRQLTSRCTNAGSYTLHVSFEPGVDLTLAQVLVQNRVNLALPALPDAVRRLGVTVTRKSPGVLLFVTLHSPDDRWGTLELGNYASIQIQDELSRRPGVSDVSLFGGPGFGLRLPLDLDRLASYDLTVGDVLKALREQDLQVVAGPIGQPATPPRQVFQRQPSPAGRAAAPDEVPDLVVKTGADGRQVRLKEVAPLESRGGFSRQFARLDGKPVVALGISPTTQASPRLLRSAVRDEMERLKPHFPPGIDYTLAFDFTASPDARDRTATPGYLLVEPSLPAGLSEERTLEILERCGTVLKETEGVQHVLTLSEDPFTRFRDGPCLVALLAAPNGKEDDRERLTRTIRTRLEQVGGAEPRLRDLSAPGGSPLGGYPVDFALRGPEDETVREMGEKLVERLTRGRKLTDVAASSGSAERHVSVDVDRAAAQAHGVSPGDIADTLDVYLGSVHVSDFNPYGWTWRAQLQIAGQPGDLAEDVKRLKVRSTRGQLLALSNLVAVRETTGPGSIDRLDFQPMVEITANPARGVSLGEARSLCETLAEDVRKELGVSPEYGLVWLQELPAAKPIPGELQQAGQDASPPEVPVSQPLVREVTEYVDFTGRTEAASTVDLRARVTGTLEKVAFREGATVKKGEVLFGIEQKSYEEALKQARANLEKEKAQLTLSEAVYQRHRALAGKNAISADELEQSRANRDVARAAVAAVEAAVAVAQLNVDWCTIRAPIDGRIGRRLLDPGNLVKADDTTLATLVSQDPTYVAFDMDERTALRLLLLAREGKIKSPREGETPILLGLADEQGFPRRGAINFVDNRLDAGTGTLRVRAVFPNADGALVPGLFARVRLPVGEPRKALLVPEEAIGTDQGQKFLYVVNDQNKAVYHRVRVGAVHDGLRVIEEGLQPGEHVIVSGLKRVRADMTVKPRQEALPVPRQPPPR